MTFVQWFAAHYQRPGEGRYRAIQRLAVETGLGWTTVLRASSGTRVTKATAEKLAALTGGRVTVADLVLAPTRREMREDTKPSELPPANGGCDAAAE